MFKNNKGFTLIELIVVVAILCLLTSLSTIAYNSALKQKCAVGDSKSCEKIKLSEEEAKKQIPKGDVCRISCAEDTSNNLADCLLRCSIIERSTK